MLHSLVMSRGLSRMLVSALGVLLAVGPLAAGFSAAPATRPAVVVAAFTGPEAAAAKQARGELERWLQTGPELRVVSAAKVDPKRPPEYRLAGALTPAGEGRITVTVTDVKRKLSEEASGEADDLSYLIQQLANRISFRLTGAWLPAPKQKDGAASPGGLRDPATTIAQALGGGRGPVKLTLGVDRGEGATYRFGDKVVALLKVDRECYVTVYNVDSQGTVTVLFPNQYSGTNHLRAGQTYTIPGADEPWEIEAGGVPGMELLSAVATLKPYAFPGTDGSKGILAFSKGILAFSKSLKDTVTQQPVPDGATSVTTRFFTVKP